MKEQTPMRKFFLVMGLAVGLPSTIIGLFFVLHQLVQNNIISWNVLLIILLIVIAYMLGLMVKKWFNMTKTINISKPIVAF